MAKNKELIEALKEELKGYELYGKAQRVKETKEAIKKAAVETKTAKPKAEKKVEKNK